MNPRPRSLTARLVVTAVALVLGVALLIAVAATFVTRAYLTDQLDHNVERTSARHDDDVEFYQQLGATFFQNGPGTGGPGPGPGGGQRLEGANALTAFLDVDGQEDAGWVLAPGDDGYADSTTISSAALSELADVPRDGEAHAVDLPGVGTYRVVVTDTPNGVAISGLPTDDVDDVVSTLITTEIALIAAGGVLALGAGLVLVRRQLRPLREVAATAHSVAELPLAEGEIELAERVPAHLTDERTEVGQVGAALNTLLAHVEDSLSARHRSEMQVRQFVADASHELRTPLATIAGYTELARRRPDDAAASAMALSKVDEESRRMTSLVEDLLLLARLDAGRPLEREPVDLTRLLLEAVSDARVLAPDHHWRLDLPEDSVEVVGDEMRLHQVVTNLLTNARKYTPAGSTVTVSARPGGFEVRDDGPGFPPELVDHAFERFARGDASRHREGGAGLGLALVQAIVSAHGGRVTLTSAPGDTRIAVRLDRAADSR